MENPDEKKENYADKSSNGLLIFLIVIMTVLMFMIMYTLYDKFIYKLRLVLVKNKVIKGTYLQRMEVGATQTIRQTMKNWSKMWTNFSRNSSNS